MLKSRFKSFKQIFYFKWGKILDTFYILLPFKIKASQRSEKFIIFLSYLILIKNRAEYLHNMIKTCYDRLRRFLWCKKKNKIKIVMFAHSLSVSTMRKTSLKFSTKKY